MFIFIFSEFFRLKHKYIAKDKTRFLFFILLTKKRALRPRLIQSAVVELTILIDLLIIVTNMGLNL